MNHPTINVSFSFEYDGTTPAVAVDLRHGPVLYQMGSGASVLHPLFSASAVSVTNVNIGSSSGSGGSLGAASVAATATVASNVLTVQIPDGLTAGAHVVSATIRF